MSETHSFFFFSPEANLSFCLSWFYSWVCIFPDTRLERSMSSFILSTLTCDPLPVAANFASVLLMFAPIFPFSWSVFPSLGHFTNLLVHVPQVLVWVDSSLMYSGHRSSVCSKTSMTFPYRPDLQ